MKRTRYVHSPFGKSFIFEGEQKKKSAWPIQGVRHEVQRGTAAAAALAEAMFFLLL